MKPMRIILLSIGVVLGSGLWTGASAQKSKCTDIPIRWFIYPVATMADGTTAPSAITGDGNWYAASSGTSNTVIHVCGTSPSRDATVTLSIGKRTIGVAFPEPIAGSATSESVRGSYNNGAGMNVRNILCSGCSKMTGEPFTTHMGVQLGGLLARNDTYRLRFMPTQTDAPDYLINEEIIPLENSPFESSPVLVLPQPYDCHVGGATKPSWIVRATNTSTDPNIAPGDSLQVGTLSRIDTKGARHAAGQYSMPFEMRIEALRCFSY